MAEGTNLKVVYMSRGRWCQSLFLLLIAMVEAMISVLDDDTTDKVLELDPWDQAGIAFAFMVTAPADSAARSSFASNLVKRFLRLRGDQTPETSPMTRAPRNGTATINVQFVLGGFSSVMVGTLMTVMQKMIPVCSSS